MLLALEMLAVTLDPIVVEGRRLPQRLIEVADRVKQGRGDYLWQQEIERSGLGALTQVLSRSPRVRIAYSNRGGRAEATPRMGMGHRECTPTVYLDGFVFPLGNFDLENLISVRDIEIIEVYRGIEVPFELGGGGLNGCGVIAVWSRR